MKMKMTENENENDENENENECKWVQLIANDRKSVQWSKMSVNGQNWVKMTKNENENENANDWE